MTWRQELYIWACAIFYALSGLIARGIRLVNEVFNTRRPAIDLPTYSRSSSFIQECDHGDAIRYRMYMCFMFGDFTLSHCFDFLAVSWAMFDPAMAKCGTRPMSRHPTRHGTRRPIPIIPSAVTKASLLPQDKYFPMKGVNVCHGAPFSRTSPSNHNTLTSHSSSATSPSVNTSLFLSANTTTCLSSVVLTSDPKLTGGVGKGPCANADVHGLPFYTKRRKVPRFSSVSDLTSFTIENVSAFPQGVATGDLADEENRVCNSVLKPTALCHESPDGFDPSLLASVTVASRRRCRAYHPNPFTAANVVDPYMLSRHCFTPVSQVPPTVVYDACQGSYLPPGIHLLAPEAEVSRHSDDNTRAIHLEQDYIFKALPETLEQESGLLPDCNRHSGLRALVLPNLVVQRISARRSLLLDSPAPLDSFNIVSISLEVDVFEKPGNVVPVLKSGGLESLRALIAALDCISPESESSNMGLSPSMSSPMSDFSIWDEDTVGEANISWGIAT